MNEQSKAALRRANDPTYRDRYFVGSGLDIGAGGDGLSKSRAFYPRMTDIREWDKADGDAEKLAGVSPNSFDFVHASHSLEHMPNWNLALFRWVEVCRRGGYLILTVPDWEMYERSQWPSRFSPEHYWAFTTLGFARRPHIVPVSYLLQYAGGDLFDLDRCVVVRDHFDPTRFDDQTLGPAECAIELVLRKR